MTNDSQLPHRASSGRDWGQLLVRLLGWVLALAFLVLVIAIVRIFYWQQLPAVYPPGPSAIRPDQTLAATTAVSSQPDVRAEDLVLTMAPTHSSAYRLYVEGRSFFPIILSDLQAAQSSIHIEIYGFEPGDLADQFNPVLKERAGAGVDVRIIVDRMGSGVSGRNTGAMFDELAAAGVQIVTNDPLPPDRVGLIGQQSLAPGVEEFLHLDHRKTFVVDGRIGWVGGAGIQDYFYEGSFQDVFARIEGPPVAQLQTIFLTTFRFHGGPLPADLSRYFPPPASAGTIPTTVVFNVPAANYRGATDAIQDLIAGAQQRLDIVDPYVADGDTLEAIVAAAQRGVRVRMVVPAASNSRVTQSALQHWYPTLQAAGVEVWLHPVLPHAKVIVADNRTLVGSTNLDAWALYRNWEVGVVFDDAAVAADFEAQLIEPDIAASTPAEPSSNLVVRLVDWLCAVWSPLL